MNNLFGWAAIIVALGGLLRVWYDVRQVHKIVNSNNERLETKVTELTRLLTESLEREARREGAEQERKSSS